MENEAKIPLIDNLHAQNLFAGGACGFFNLNGTIIITLEAPHMNHGVEPGEINRVVVARLVMPAAGAYGLAAGLFDFLKNQGFNFPTSEGGATPH